MPPRPAVLLTGASGFFGRYLHAELGARGVRVITAGRSGADVELELGDPAAPAAAVDAAWPDVVLSCAAMASLAACERAPDAAWTINAAAPAAFAARGVRVVQISTDLVFDGRHAPYGAGDPVQPLSVYGTTKAAAERAVVGAGGLVVRVPLLIGRSHDGRRGATDMIRSAASPIVLFTDEHRTPLHAADAARGVADLLLAPGAAGIVHLAGRERVSRWELAQRFAAAAGISLAHVRAGLAADPRRPADVSLRTDWDCGRSLDAALREC
jgi:dTDP-4-dehydrorhamnose reductase